jgi:hypothetical protein
MNLRTRIDKLEQRTKAVAHSSGVIILEASDPMSKTEAGIEQRWLEAHPGESVPGMLVCYVIVDPLPRDHEIA